ncbi:hypothetical protein LC612_39420 [Nostoc sp. CHAB 5834]|nr:hypothetical protein [Nostoc sp. CHAB 5834]
MQQDVFTCRFVPFDDRLCPVHWLRIVLPNVAFGKDQLRLLRVNEKFSVMVKPFCFTDEIDALYALYRESITFDASESVQSCLTDGTPYTAFDTYAIEVRDGDLLIAVGIFDNGLVSIAGIMNFYHPAYRKYSLGKYLMLQKINFARQQQKAYYYPGYLVSHYPKFDYKLFACEAATEVFDANRSQWYPFSWPTVTFLSAEMMEED